VAGGVSANSGLRNAIIEMGVQEQWSVHIPRFEYCTDNAAMIAITGKLMLDQGIVTSQSVSALARVDFNKLSS
jgi:N6-L-threonylcarbamoyladenine synthase